MRGYFLKVGAVLVLSMGCGLKGSDSSVSSFPEKGGPTPPPDEDEEGREREGIEYNIRKVLDDLNVYITAQLDLCKATEGKTIEECKIEIGASQANTLVQTINKQCYRPILQPRESVVTNEDFSIKYSCKIFEKLKHGKKDSSYGGWVVTQKYKTSFAEAISSGCVYDLTQAERLENDACTGALDAALAIINVD